MSEQSQDILKPLEKDPDHFRRLAYATAYRKWLRVNKLQASDESWERFKACHCGRAKSKSDVERMDRANATMRSMMGI